jgi:penicillin-binding protein 1C
VMLLDHRNGNIVAYAGSADFSNAEIFGQVDGLRAKRSPGSTLKPLIYALALDQGLIHAKSLLRDVPASFGYFAPENFDLRFQGPVDATQALIRSRNLPAVYLASKLEPDLYASLQTAGVSRLASREHYGLSLALGGGEVSAIELARIYTALAGDGTLKTLSVLKNPPSETGVDKSPLVSAEAAWIVRRMLEENPRTDNARKAEQLKVAWKTGTSWGFRDAWSVGIFGQYVMVVWVGNFDGSSHPGLVGRNSAAPLFFAIVDRLQASKHINAERDYASNLNVRELQVCASNGELPNRWCPRKSLTYYIPGRSPIGVSELHQPLVLDRSNQVRCDELALLRLQRGEGVPGLRLEIVERWPAAMAAAFQQAGVLKKTWPRCEPGNALASEAPSIIEPQDKLTLRIRPQALATSSISFKALGAQPLHWFIDGALVGTSNNAQRFEFRAARFGKLQVRVVDSAGLSATRELSVEAY